MTSCRQYPDPYVLNSKGNVLASLGRWKGAAPRLLLPFILYAETCS